jgi:N-methylhydantoinase A
VINAYIQPVMSSYLSQLESRMRELGVTTPKLYIMQSNGGVSTFKGSAEKPVATVLSGPAGGVIASMGTCERVGINNIITFDMGGTSCDVALIHKGNPVITTQGKISMRPISLPMLDIHTVSAGGGTIARIDAVGGLQVGPDSAGADPGPVSYDRGGQEITVTDANIVTGVLDPDQFLGGRMKLNKAKAERLLEEKIAKPLKLNLLEAADGVIKIINAKMEEAIKAVSSARGYDIRDFTLVAFGGGGPMHAGRMALDLGIPSVLVPLTPGVHSALGLLMSDVKHDYVRSKLVGLDDLDLKEINNLYAQLIERAKADLHDEGFHDDEIKIDPYLDLRYAGQGYELTVPCIMPPLKPEDDARAEFRPQGGDRTGRAGKPALDLPRTRAAGEALARQSYRTQSRGSEDRRAQGFLRQRAWHADHADLHPRAPGAGAQAQRPGDRRTIGHDDGDPAGAGSRRGRISEYYH